MTVTIRYHNNFIHIIISSSILCDIVSLATMYRKQLRIFSVSGAEISLPESGDYL